jgi:Transglycosylase SLT domain
MIDLSNVDPASLSPHQQEVVGKTIAEAQNQGIDPNLAVAIANQESDFNHLKDGKLNCSDKGACGAFQLMPETAKKLGINPRNIDQNIKGGISLLKENLNRYDNNDLLATLAYNTSEATRNKFMETGDPSVLPKEAIDYVKNIHSQHPLQGVTALGTENNPFLGNQPNPIVQDIQQEQQAQQPQNIKVQPEGNYARMTPEGVEIGITTGSVKDAAQQLMSPQNPALIGAGVGAGARLLGGPIQPPKPISFADTTGIKDQIVASHKNMASTLAKAHEAEAIAEQAARDANLKSFMMEAAHPQTVEYMRDPLRLIPTPEAATLLTQGRGSSEDKLGTTGKQGSQYTLESMREAEQRRSLAGKATPRESFLVSQGPQTATPSGVQVPRKLAYEVHDPIHEQIAQQIQAARKTADEADAAHAAAQLHRQTTENAAKILAAENAKLAKSLEPSLLNKALAYGQKGIENVGYGISKIPGINTLGTIAGGAGAGYDLAQTINRARQGDIPGAAISGLGALSGTVSMFPHPLAKGLGLAGGLTSAGLEYLRNQANKQPQPNIQTKGLAR